jgi:hypothetical protein
MPATQTPVSLIDVMLFWSHASELLQTESLLYREKVKSCFRIMPGGTIERRLFLSLRIIPIVAERWPEIYGSIECRDFRASLVGSDGWVYGNYCQRMPPAGDVEHVWRFDAREESAMWPVYQRLAAASALNVRSPANLAAVPQAHRAAGPVEHGIREDEQLVPEKIKTDQIGLNI